MNRLLLVDDEVLLVKSLKTTLENEGFFVETAYDGEEAYEKFRLSDFDLIILDIMLPKIDGYSLCKMIRSESQIPIIMLTARGDDIDKILGLEMGADDYLAKPFNPRELIARIKAILRRLTNAAHISDIIKKDGLVIDLIKHKVALDNKDLELTAKEYDLLVLFAKNPGRVYTRDQLLEVVWGYDFAGDDRTVDVHIRRLREKIERQPARPAFILTKWGVGYYFSE